VALVDTNYDLFLDNLGLKKLSKADGGPLDLVLEGLFDMIISVKLEMEEL